MHSVADSGKISRSERRLREEVARVNRLLILKGLTLTKIDQEFGLPAGTASNTLKEPHLAGERAIAAALGRRPEHLWFSRYFASGERKKPQPAENYRNGRRAVAGGAGSSAQEAA